MITLHNIGVRYADREVLSALNTTIADGGITAVMGANGCGKTTLLRLIGGLQQPSTGRVEIDGTDVSHYSARALAQKVSFVRQHARTDLDFSAFEIVLMGRNPYQRRLQNESQADWNIVEQAMRQTGVWHLRFARPNMMSGGELQRVMIARALAQQTPVMLLDEPVSNLDIAHQIDIMRLLRQATDKTILIVIHDLNLALHYCDRLLLIASGRLLFDGPIAAGLTPANIAEAYGVSATVADGRVSFCY